MITGVGEYLRGNVTETGETVFSGISETGEYAPLYRVAYLFMSGGLLCGGPTMLRNSYALYASGGTVTGGNMALIRYRILQISGGMVVGGSINFHSYALDMRNMIAKSNTYTFAAARVDKRFTATEV